MASIEQDLQNIINARYGKDVRQSIHDAIRDINIKVDGGSTATYTLITNSTVPATAGFTISKYVDGELQSSVDYVWEDITTPVNIDGVMTIQYDIVSTYKFTYTLLVPSNEHPSGYNYAWAYTEEVNISESFTEHTVKNMVVVGKSAIADYVCDGVADNVEFQTAIDQVSAHGGGIVYVENGNYTFNTAVHPRSNIELIMGTNTVITMDAQQSWTLPTPTTADETVIPVDDTILDYVVIGQAVGFTDGSTGYLPMGEHSFADFISDIDYDNKTITLYSAVTGEFTTMVTLDSAFSSIEWLDGYTQNVTIRGGVIDGNVSNQSVWIRDMSHNGILIGECKNLRIEGVTVRNVYFQGIHVVASAHQDYSTATAIKGCHVYNALSAGICVDSSRYVTVEDCVVVGGNTGDGVQVIYSFNTRISNCYVSQAPVGINITGNSLVEHDHNISIDGCVIIRCAIGIYLMQSNDIMISDSVIQRSATKGVDVNTGSHNVTLNGLIVKNSGIAVSEASDCADNVANGLVMHSNTTNYNVNTMQIGLLSNVSLRKVSNTLIQVLNANGTVVGTIAVEEE